LKIGERSEFVTVACKCRAQGKSFYRWFGSDV